MSRRFPRLLVLVALAAGLVAAGGRRKKDKGFDKDPLIPTAAVEALRAGNLGRAWVYADRFLRRNPTRRVGWAVLGGIESLRGWAPEAVSAFESGTGTQWYLGPGRPLLADALRDAGRGHEAAALRREVLLDEKRVPARMRAYAALVDDLRAAGDASGAEDALAEALGQWPRSSLLLSVAADVALDAGDVAAAEGWLTLIDHLRMGPVRRTLVVQLRLARVQGQHERVDHVARVLGRSPGYDPVVQALVAHSLCDRGEAEEALALLGDGLGRGDVVVAVAEARALALAGDARAAREQAVWLSARHPGQPDVAALVAFLADDAQVAAP